MKNKFSKFLTSAILTTTSLTTVSSLGSCSENNLYKKLTKLSNVVKVEQLEQKDDFKERYLIWFKQPLDWTDESKGYFNQRVELNFRGYDRMNQIFTSGYELRDCFKEPLVNNFEIGKRYGGNVIQIEFRFFDQSIPDGLTPHSTKYWEYLTYANATEDFHAIITSLKTIFSGKWAFSGTSKGGETTNVFALTYPNDCDAYVPYVAPKFYARGDDTFTKNVYTTIGEDVLGKTLCDEWKNEIYKLQYYLLVNRDKVITKFNKTLVEFLWESEPSSEYTDYACYHHDYMYDLCVEEFATAFWQYDQNIEDIKYVNNLSDEQEKLAEAVNLLVKVNGPSGYCINKVDFGYHVQAAREMGEYNYDFSFMIDALIAAGYTDVEDYIKVPSDERKDFYWKITLPACLYEEYYKKDQDMTMANKLEQWNRYCNRPVFRIYGGADPWYALRLDDATKSSHIQIFVGKDTTNPYGRSHRTRISTLLPDEQAKAWAELDKIFKD